MSSKENINRDDPDYGPQCKPCGGKKSLNARVCRKCRDKERRGLSLWPLRHASPLLFAVWPIPFPMLSGEPRKIVGVCHVEKDGSGVRDA